MNASRPVARIEAEEWDVVHGHHYTASAYDFPEGCGVITCARTGDQWAIGKNKLGSTVRVKLNVPLCHGCDNPIPKHGVCTDCCVVHGDVAAEGLTESHGDPLLDLELDRLGWRGK